MKRILLLVGLALAGAASTAIAQPVAPPSGPADPYGAGARERGPRQPGARGERKQRMKRALVARFDHNRDGRLTGRERAQAKRFVQRHKMMRTLRRFDVDQDGWLSPEEQQAARQARQQRGGRGGRGRDGRARMPL